MRADGEKTRRTPTLPKHNQVTMQVAASCATALLSSIAAPTLAFAPRSPPSARRIGAPSASPPLFLSAESAASAATPTEISGAPSAEARDVEPREALSGSTVYRLDGTPVPASALLRDDGGVGLVVLTRSFG